MTTTSNATSHVTTTPLAIYCGYYLLLDVVDGEMMVVSTLLMMSWLQLQLLHLQLE